MPREGQVGEGRVNMDVIERAQRRYRELVPDDLVGAKTAERDRRLSASRIEAWVTSYVIPAIEEVWERPAFREHATWPQRSLVAGADTDERAAIERVDTTLVAEAKALRGLLRNKLVVRRLDTMHREAAARRNEATSTTVIDDEEWCVGLPTKHELIPFYRSQLEEMSRRAWTDLACVEDFFGPSGGMMRKTPLPKGTTEAAMVVSLTPHLFCVGDSITRCMLHRGRSWTGFLAEARSVCYEAIQRVQTSYDKQVEAERAAWRELQESSTELQRLCLIGREARIRESCITLVRTRVEFQPNVDVQWVGVPEAAIRPFRGQLRRVLLAQRDLETLDRIAVAVTDLKLLYRDLDSSVPEHDEAIASGGLVLIDATCQAYWQGREIRVDWNRYRKSWELLWKLATNARIASAVGNFDLYSEGVPDSTFYNRWRRLKELIPAALHRHVVPGRERATYRLSLPIQQIHLFSATGR